MRNVMIWIGGLTLATCFAAIASVMDGEGEEAPLRLPVKISRADQTGAIFERGDVIRTERGGNTTQDVTTLLSSDGRFGSGMYRSGATRFEVDEPYGVDEFMYFLEGGVTLTSGDGTVQVIEAGEAVTIPKEWTGIWETNGYTKIWVIYWEDGSGL